MKPIAIGVCLILLAVGCGEPSDANSEVVVSDSSGVQLVKSASPAWSAGSESYLSDEPTVRIGSLEGDPAYQFFSVSDGAVRPDGHILVLDQGAHELREYTPSGVHVRTSGGEGGGPGEFRFPRHLMLLPGDSMLVFDLSRVNLLGPTGEAVRTFPAMLSPPRGRFSDGTILTTVEAEGVNPSQLGEVQPDLNLVRRDIGGSHADTLTHVTGSTVIRVEAGAGIAMYGPPFPVNRMVAVHDDQIFTGDGSWFEVKVLGEDGQLSRIMRRSETDRRVTASVRRANDSARIEGARTESQRAVLTDLAREWEYPEQWPAYDRLVVSSDGHVWIRHYSLGAGATIPWSVFAPSGEWLSDVPMPSRLEVLAIGSDYVLGKVTDELDVEYIHFYRIEAVGG